MSSLAEHGAPRRDEDDPFGTRVAGRSRDSMGAGHIDPQITHRIPERHRHAGSRNEMEDDIRPPATEEPVETGRPDIPVLELRVLLSNRLSGFVKCDQGEVELVPDDMQ